MEWCITSLFYFKCFTVQYNFNLTLDVAIGDNSHILTNGDVGQLGIFHCCFAAAKNLIGWHKQISVQRHPVISKNLCAMTNAYKLLYTNNSVQGSINFLFKNAKHNIQYNISSYHKLTTFTRIFLTEPNFGRLMIYMFSDVVHSCWWYIKRFKIMCNMTFNCKKLLNYYEYFIT